MMLDTQNLASFRVKVQEDFNTFYVIRLRHNFRNYVIGSVFHIINHNLLYFVYFISYCVFLLNLLLLY